MLYQGAGKGDVLPVPAMPMGLVPLGRLLGNEAPEYLNSDCRESVSRCSHYSFEEG